MVKGVTNMTVRIRYNGFFCWLMTFIAERLQATNPSKIDNPKEQIKYIRRGELLLACKGTTILANRLFYLVQLFCLFGPK